MPFVAVEEPPGILRKVDRVDRGLSEGGFDDAVEDRVEQRVLAAEVVVDLRLVGPGRPGDTVDPRSSDPAGRELLRRRVEQALPGRFRISDYPRSVAN
jgi:hypothetical protein